MIRVKGDSPDNKRRNAERMKAAIDGLMGVVPELLSMEVGMNLSTKASAYDLVLTSTFDSMETLDIYRVHPEHQKVLELLHELMESTAVVDYQF